MLKKRIRALIKVLLSEVEEEDVGIGLFSIFAASAEDLSFFRQDDKERVLDILKILSDDSRRHKEMLDRIVNALGDRL